jgi:hypothetical protein
MFNSPSFAKPSIIERSLLDQTIKLVRDHIPQRTANLLILSHYPVILSPIDPGKLEENNFERHVWKEATELVARLCAAVEKETNLLWFSGDIHRGEIVYPSVKDRAILVSVAGRLGGTAHFGRGPTVHLVEIKNHQITTHTCEWQAEGHDNKKHSMGTWKLRKNASQGKNSQGRTKKKEVSSNRPLVNSLKNSIEVTVAHDLEQEIVASIAKYRWLHLGRFATSRSSGATLLWLNTDEFFGHEDALLEEIIRRLVEQMRERLPAITNDNLNAFMLGIDAYGSLIASLVGSSLGLPVVCAAVNGGTSNKAIFRKVDKGLLRGYLKERSVIILVSDVVRTGRSVAEVIAEIKSAHEELQKEGHNSLLHTPIFHLVSVVLNRDGSQWLQQLADDVESILCCCQSIDLMLIDDNKLPPLELLPNTRFLVS